MDVKELSKEPAASGEHSATGFSPAETKALALSTLYGVATGTTGLTASPTRRDACELGVGDLDVEAQIRALRQFEQSRLASASSSASFSLMSDRPAGASSLMSGRSMAFGSDWYRDTPAPATQRLPSTPEWEDREDGPCCGVYGSFGFSMLCVLGAWFVTVLALSCFPWAFLGPQLAGIGIALGLLAGAFVRVLPGSQTTGLVSYTCDRCNGVVKTHQRVSEFHPQSKLVLSTAAMAFGAVVGFLISRGSIPNATVSSLSFVNRKSVSGDPLVISGVVSIPWCAPASNSVSVRVADSGFPFAVHNTGSFSGSLSVNSSLVGTTISGMMASCGGCFTESLVQSFLLAPPGWLQPVNPVPFIDTDSFGTYVYPVLAIAFLLAGHYVCYCMYVDFPICAIPPICHHHKTNS
jgi:hypothetical protein